MLNHYSSRPPNEEIKGPIWLWYWHCVMPTLMFVIALQISVHTNGQLMALGMGVILVVCAQQKHRLNHNCRLVRGFPDCSYCCNVICGII